MNEIDKLLSSGSFEEVSKTIDLIKSKAKGKELIDNYIKEYENHDRNIRDTQVGFTQKDPTVKGNLIKAIRLKVPFQKKIVTTSTAFEFGEPITINHGGSELEEELMKLWDSNRIDDKLQKAKLIQKSQTECAFEFYIKEDLESKSKQIKVKILSNKEGVMSPYFDDYGDMVAFYWNFTTKDTEGKEVKNFWIWTDKLCYKFVNDGKYNLISNLPHGFDKIPIVYASQENPEWFDAISLIDRYETCISRLSGSNDYSGHPLLKTFGKIVSMPDRDDDGKTIRFEGVEVEQAGGGTKLEYGNAEFLINPNAPESVRLEMENLESNIFSLVSTPNLSFNNLKTNLGDISGNALEFVFLDSKIKAKINEGENRTIIQRIINVLISGIVTTTSVKLSSQRDSVKTSIQFNSILPNNLKEAVEIATMAKMNGILSSKKAIEFIDIADDLEEELDLINSEKVIDNVIDK